MDLTKKTLVNYAVFILILGFVLIGIVVKLTPDQNPYSSVPISSSDDACGFLTELGWECDQNNVEIKESLLPNTFDQIFTEYNDLQIQQGCDLSKYLGETITVYTIPITNYGTNKSSVYATLIVHKNQIIGGDIHSAEINGFMHTLQ